MIYFKELLKIAIKCIKNAKIPDEEWSFGGGSALTFYYEHRISLDVDIFLLNPQYLTFLSPRLNEVSASISESYNEQSNFLKISYGKQEIDFIIAPNLTGLLPEKKRIDKLFLWVEQPEEIIAKKLFYRAESLKSRDIVN